MRGRLDTDALRALRAISHHGGVTRAAEHLALSQSAVSHKIRRLEENIDCALLNRKPGLPLLTETGERLLSFANRILALHDEAFLSLSKRRLSGKVRLGITEDMTSSGLARILGRFARLFPQVAVRTHVAQSLVLQNELEEGMIDIGAMQVWADAVRPTDLLLCENSLCWAKSLDFQLPKDGPIPFLAYDDQCFYKKWLQEQGLACGRQFECVLQCSSNGGIAAGIEAGLGVSIVNERHVSPTMEVIEEGFVTPPPIAYIVRVASKSGSKAVGALAEEIVRELREIPALAAS